MEGMTNTETKEHMLKWVKTNNSHWSWPTDACGYEQHMKFVDHRNKNYIGETEEDFNQFVINYANSLEEESCHQI